VTDKPHVTTADELDAMTPAERRAHFRASTVDPEDLPPALRAKFDADAETAIARHRAKVSAEDHRHAS
jgi:hypothetical protein